MTDIQTIQAFKESGDKRLLSQLFKKYKGDVFGLAYYYLSNKTTAVDTVMDTFEVVLKTIDTKEITYFKGWILGICRNQCLKKLRDTKSFVELKESSEIFVENDEETVYSNENIEKLLDLIPQLKENQRICIDAFYLKKQSYDEISAMTGFTFKQVKSYVQNGKRNLKNMFLAT